MHRTAIQALHSVRHIFRWAWFVPLCVLPIHADVVVYVYQSGPNVVSSYSGTIDLTGLTPHGFDGPTPPFIRGADATEVFGPTATDDPVYLGITGATNFGDGAEMEASSGSGDTFGYAGSSGLLLLPAGYISGTFISGTDIWDDTTLAGLGLTPGTYDYTWGTGTDGSFTLNIGTAPVPEPSSLGLMSLVVLAMAFALLRHRLHYRFSKRA
jgi:PEP-CTERM motif